jgi:hypothetical protein
MLCSSNPRFFNFSISQFLNKTAMSNIIDFDSLYSFANDVTLDEALTELKRENKMRRQCYERWSRLEPQKIDAYKRQYVRSLAVQLVIASMEPIEFRRRLLAQSEPLPSLFKDNL